MKSIFSFFLVAITCITVKAATFGITVPKSAADGAESGWNIGFDVGTTGSWNFNDQFIGIANGHYWSFGGKIQAHANYFDSTNEWRNTFSLLETLTRTPVIDSFLKSADQIAVESVYLWKFAGWFGLYAQANLASSIFAGKDVRATPVIYRVTDLNNVVSTVVSDNFTLTDPFLPLALSQSVGLFALLAEDQALVWDVKTGLSLKETLANGQMIISGDSGTIIDIATLANFFQIGPSVGTGIHGELLEKMLTYQAYLDLMYVAWRDSQKVLPGDFTNRFNLAFMGVLSYKITEWASLNFDFKAIREPDIQTAFQLQSNLLLTLSYKL